MRLSALLIDDETPILHNLQMVVPWRELGIDIVGLAKNGQQAMDIALRHRPDIILCDIRMPVMDGIAFLQRLRETDTDAEVVMLTGYQDFEYARTVLRHGARDYMLKPIDYGELTAVVERLANAIRARRRERMDEAKRIGKAMVLAYEKTLHDLLLGYASGNAPHLLHDGDSGAAGRRYAILLADFDDYAVKCRSYDDKERNLWNFAVRNVLQEALKPEGLRYAVLQMREGEWCVVIERAATDGPPGRGAWRRWAAMLQQAVADHLKIDLSIGFLPAEVQLEELAGAFRKLQRSVHLAAGKKRSIIEAGGREAAEAGLDTVWPPVDDLVSALKRGDRDSAEAALGNVNERFAAISARSLGGAEKAADFIVLHLLREMRELQALDAEEEREVWTLMERADRVKDKLAVVRRIVGASLEAMHAKKSSDRLMHAAKDYIRRNLGRDFGIDEVAGHIGISVSYFSLLFKQHFGCTFVEYVTAERIELAKSMLLLTDKSVTEIGRAVGFAERRYFTRVFQKVTGDIPSVFREKRTKQTEAGT